MFEKLKNFNRRLDERFFKLQYPLYQWHGFKLFLAVVATFCFLGLVQIHDHFLEWFFNIVCFGLVFLIFHQSREGEVEEKAKESAKILKGVGIKIVWLNKHLFQWHFLKLFLAYLTANHLIQHFRTEQMWLNLTMGMLFYFIAGLLFIPPKDPRSSKK